MAALSSRRTRISGCERSGSTAACLADDQTGLGSAEELVAAEEDEVGPGRDAVLGSGFDGQAEVASVEQAAAADVVDQHDVCVVGDGSEFCQEGSSVKPTMRKLEE